MDLCSVLEGTDGADGADGTHGQVRFNVDGKGEDGERREKLSWE